MGGYFSDRLSRNLTFGASGTYSRLTMVSAAASSYNAVSVGGTLGYTLTRRIGLNLRYDFTKYDQIENLYVSNVQRASIGFVFNSRDVPITVF